ncbi:MAG: septum formation initiator family protein [Candidatus Kryptoniota bacterium]
MSNQDEQINVNSDREEAKPSSRHSGKKVPSVSKFILILAGVVGIFVWIVNNSVNVDLLVAKISSLDSLYSKLKYENDSLQAEVKKLSSAERITKIASTKLGLTFSNRSLKAIELDRDLLEKAEKKDAEDSARSAR